MEYIKEIEKILLRSRSPLWSGVDLKPEMISDFEFKDVAISSSLIFSDGGHFKTYSCSEMLLNIVPDKINGKTKKKILDLVNLEAVEIYYKDKSYIEYDVPYKGDIYKNLLQDNCDASDDGCGFIVIYVSENGGINNDSN